MASIWTPALPVQTLDGGYPPCPDPGCAEGYTEARQRGFPRVVRRRFSGRMKCRHSVAFPATPEARRQHPAFSLRSDIDALYKNSNTKSKRYAVPDATRIARWRRSVRNRSRSRCDAGTSRTTTCSPRGDVQMIPPAKHRRQDASGQIRPGQFVRVRGANMQSVEMMAP